MIPTKIMNEIPLPTPLSVILSPNHKINILPAANIMVEEIVNHRPAGNEEPAAWNGVWNMDGNRSLGSYSSGDNPF